MDTSDKIQTAVKHMKGLNLFYKLRNGKNMKLHSFPPNYASKIIKDPQEPIKNTHYWSEQKSHINTWGK